MSEATEQKPLEIQVPEEVAYQLKLMEFDKNITMAKAQIADMERQKMDFVYQTAINGVANKYGQKQDTAPVTPAPEAPVAA
jgi:hypothetical protein